MNISNLLSRFIRLNRQASSFLARQMSGIFGGVDCYKPLVDQITDGLASRHNPVVIEVGGVDRPILKKASTFTYVGVDIDYKDRCDSVYDGFITQSIEDPLSEQGDLIISNTLLEHVPDNNRAIASIFGALRCGGETHHYMPSKWHPYSVLLRIIGPKLQVRMIALLRSEASDVSGYPAYFSHCSPAAMKSLFERHGFVEVEVKCFYRANDYFAFFTPAYIFVSLYENFCSVFGLRFLSSGFVISAVRPATGKK